MELLLASVLALAIGPLLVRAGERNAQALLRGIDGFVVVSTIGLVFLHIFPQSIVVTGWSGVWVAVLGVITPGIFERLHLHREQAAWGRTLINVLIVAGLAAHALFDGVALIGEHHGDHQHVTENLLWLGIVLHRLPMGLFIWWVLKPRYGIKITFGFMALIVVMSSLGFFVGKRLFDLVPFEELLLFQTFVAGCLVHIVNHHSPLVRAQGAWQWASGLGSLLGFALVIFLAQEEALFPVTSSHISFSRVVLLLTLQIAPALLLAFVAMAFLKLVIVSRLTLDGKRSSFLGQILRGLGLGMPLPIYSWDTLLMFRRLSQKSAAPYAAFIFLIAMPLVDLGALFVSLPLLGIHFALVRCVATVLFAIGMGLFLTRFLRTELTHVSHAMPWPYHPRPVLKTIRDRFVPAFTEIIEHTVLWVLLGLVASALIYAILDLRWFIAQSVVLQMALLLLLSAPLYVCPIAITPIATVLWMKGVSPGAVLAMVLVAPLLPGTIHSVLRLIAGRRSVSVTLGAAIVLSVAMGLALTFGMTTFSLTMPVPNLFSDGKPAFYHWMCAGALGVLLMIAVLKHGPRAFIYEVIGVHHSHPHDEKHSSQ